MTKFKLRKWRGRGLVLALAVAFLVGFFAITADARIAIITGNGNIRLLPSKPDKVTTGTGLFSDSNSGSFSDPAQPASRTIATGLLSAPGTVFWSGSDTKAGSLSLLLRAIDSNVPNGNGTTVSRYRNATLSQPYDDKGNPITNFSVDTALSNIEDAPPPASGKAMHIGFDLSMNPIVFTTLEVVEGGQWVGDYSPTYYPVSSYHYKVTQDETNLLVSEGDVSPNNGKKAEFNLNPAIFKGWTAGKYWITPTAKNGYVSLTIPAREGTRFSFEFSAGAGGPLSYPITVEVTPNKPGFNFISIPMPPNTKTGTWLATTADGATSLGKIATAYDLIKAINYAAGKGTGKKFISTFGKWDATGQLDAGILIPANDPDGTAKAALQAIKLEAGVGYQVYLGKDPATNLWPSEIKTTIIIKN